MKNLTLIFLTMFLFFTFSCASTDTGENDDLLAENDGLRQEKLELENENSELLNEITQFLNNNEELKSEINDLLSENTRLSFENEELKTDNTTLNDGIDELLNIVDEYLAHNNELRDANAQVVSDNEHLRGSITDLNRGIESLIDEIVQLIDSNDLLINRVNDLLADNNQLRNNVSELLSLNQNTRNENDQLAARIQALVNENTELARSNNDLGSRLDELRNWFTNMPPSSPADQAAAAVETPTAQEAPASLVIAEQQITRALPDESAAAPEKDEPANEISPFFAPVPAVRLDSLTQMGMTPLDTQIQFSRIVRATTGQILEIPFRGSGWVYLGEIASRRGIVYDSRRNDADGQSFIFSLNEPGTYILRFYRQDFIRDFILNDHVQVIVGEAQAAAAGWFNPSLDRARVVAQPRWPSAIEEAQIISGTRSPSEPVVTSSAAQTTSQTTTPSQPLNAQQAAAQQQTAQTQQTTPTQQQAASQTAASIFSADSYPGATNVYNPQLNNLNNVLDSQNPDSQNPDSQIQDLLTQPPEYAQRVSPNELIQRARDSFDNGNIAAAIPLLNQYLDYYPGGTDESLWLLGQLYEANSPERNILLSLDYYRRLTNDYPQSSRYEDARRRVAYLERFYITIQ
ncbi:MAG: hypothetical protein FWC21_06880 [Treponema sp.]|nr:hypothetical protein [Treponema sp.]